MQSMRLARASKEMRSDPQVSRRSVARTAAWSIPVVTLVGSVPAASASPLVWSLIVEATPQDCAAGVNGGATTIGGYQLTNTGTASGTGPIIGVVALLVYTGQIYGSEAEATAALDAADTAFENDPPASTVDGPTVTTYPWSQTDSQVFDLGDGTFTVSSIYQQQHTILDGLGAVGSVTVNLTVHDLPDEFLIQGYFTPVTPVDSAGDYGDQVFLFDSAWCGIFPPDNGLLRRRRSLRAASSVIPPVVHTWFKQHPFRKVR